MASAQKQYTHEMYKKFGYYATWNPGEPLKLGDIGTLDGKLFTRISNLENEGIAFRIRKDNTRTNLQHHTDGGVSVTQKLAGKAAPAGSVFGDIDAGIIVEFTKDKAILFKANDTVTDSIEDAISLGKEVLRRHQEGNWDKNLVIITQLIEAETATILISNKANTKVELKAQANIEAASLDIADAGFQFGTNISGSLETEIVAKEGLTPLFKVMGIHKRIFRPSIFESYQELPVYPDNFDRSQYDGREIDVFGYPLEEEEN